MTQEPEVAQVTKDAMSILNITRVNLTDKYCSKFSIGSWSLTLEMLEARLGKLETFLKQYLQLLTLTNRMSHASQFLLLSLKHMRFQLVLGTFISEHSDIRKTKEIINIYAELPHRIRLPADPSCSL